MSLQNDALSLVVTVSSYEKVMGLRLSLPLGANFLVVRGSCVIADAGHLLDIGYEFLAGGSKTLHGRMLPRASQ